MRIIYISDSSIPSYSANSIQVMKMCQAWSQQGHDVTLMAKRTTASLKNVNDIYGFYGVTGTFKLAIHPSASFPGSGRIYNWLLPFWMRGSHYDVRYTRSIYAAFWSAVLHKEIAFEIHEPFDTKQQGWWLKSVFKHLARNRYIVKWVFISEALKEGVLSSYPSIAEHRCLVAYDGADALQVKPIPMANTGRRRVGYVGSLLKGKGMEIIIPLSKICGDAEFHIVGGNKSDIRKLKAQLDKGQDNVIFYGFVPPTQTPGYIEQFDILIAPYGRGVFVENEKNSNNIAQWMSPLKIFEYMSSAKPIITSDLPVLKEILVHGENCLLCDPDRLQTWKDAISELSSDPVLAARIGERAQSDFVQRHTWQERAGKILKSIVPQHERFFDS